MARRDHTSTPQRRDHEVPHTVSVDAPSWAPRSLLWIWAPGGSSLLVLGISVCALLATLVLGMAHGLVESARERDEERLTITAPLRIARCDAVSVRTSDMGVQHEQRDDGSTSLRGERPSIQWRRAVVLRRAAGMLLLDDDYDAAMALLLQITDSDARAFALDKGAHRMLLAVLRPAVIEQRGRLLRFWRRLDARQRLALVGDGGAEAVARTQRFLDMKPGTVHLPQCAELLPEDILICFVRNVHVRLVRSTGANHSLIALMLTLALPQHSVAETLYWERFPQDWVSYPEELMDAPPERKGSRTP